MNFFIFAIGFLVFLYIIGSVLDDEQPTKAELVIMWLAFAITLMLAVRVFI